MPLTNIFISEIFYIWSIDFMGQFSSSFGNLYIHLVVDYMSELTYLIGLESLKLSLVIVTLIFAIV
jgi:hypothetical protein